MCVALAVFAVVPSPKLMLALVIEPPALGSLDPAVEALTVRGAVPEVGVTASLATGGWLGAVAVTVALEGAAKLLEVEAVTDDDGISLLVPPPQPMPKAAMANAQNRTQRRTIRLPISNPQVGSKARQTVRGPLYETNWNFLLGQIGFCT